MLLITGLWVRSTDQSSLAAQAEAVCRFGITSPLGSQGYDIARIGVGSYLDWGAASNPVLPGGVEYIRVLRLRDDLYSHTLAALPGLVTAHPGSVWVIGNEPDTRYGGQDALVAQVYADRYYELAAYIRSHDPSARLAFGSIVQPTPIRLRYLDKAWDKLVANAGTPAEASSLIDIWSIHSFILNEQVGQWGTGIPPGFELDHTDAVTITDFSDTYSIDILQQRVIDFRTWMADKGERAKPLWITEYGSLFPPIDPTPTPENPNPPDYYNVSDADTAAFMLASFDFMLQATHAQTGLPADGNRLVQRWFWYSLNEHRYVFGGSLFDPENEKSTTLVGQEFIDYQALALAQPDLFPLSLIAAPVGYSADPNLVNYRLVLKIGNALAADTGAVSQVWFYDGDPEAGGSLIGTPVTSQVVQRCGGSGFAVLDWPSMLPFIQHTIYVHVAPIGVEDSDPGDNWASFSIIPGLPELLYFPLINR